MSVLLLSQDAELINRCRRAVSAEHEMHVVGNYIQLRAEIAALKPSVILLDSAILENAEREVADVAASWPEGHVIVMTQAFEADVEVALLKAGAKGCCRRGIDPESLQQVLTVTHGGGVWVTRSLLPRLVMELHRYAAAHNARATVRPGIDHLAGLTVREREVIRLVVEGATNKEVAAALEISERTVKGHLSNIFQKLGVPDRLKLVVYVKQRDATARNWNASD
jgi:Response regulator containing a CheY-like receiver domain and an HTH DNA-binding domain